MAEDPTPPTPSARDARRSDRIRVSLPIQVLGTDLAGQDFNDLGSTRQLARYGGSIVTKRSLAPGQVVTIYMLQGSQEAQARVIGQVETQPEGHLYGIAFLKEEVGFWGIGFPPLTEGEQFLTKLVIECLACRQREIVPLNETELEVFEASGRLSRTCQRCRDWTIWRQAKFESKEAAEEPLATVV